MSVWMELCGSGDGGDDSPALETPFVNDCVSVSAFFF